MIGKPKRGKGFRFWKSVGLGFKTPKTAIEGTYVDIRNKVVRFRGTEEHWSEDFEGHRITFVTYTYEEFKPLVAGAAVRVPHVGA